VLFSNERHSEDKGDASPELESVPSKDGYDRKFTNLKYKIRTN